MRRTLLLFISALTVVCVGAQPARKRGITAQDYLSFVTPGDAQIAPDGQSVAYTVTSIDAKANRRSSRIWVSPFDGGSPAIAYTSATLSSNSPRWSPDGKSLSFLSARDGGRPQIWVLSLKGGEARKLTNVENGVSACEWSPDSTRFVCLTRTGPSASKTSDVRHYKHIRYKFNDSGYFDEKRSHLVVIDAKTGVAQQITDGSDWNDLDPHWSPDSTRIAFVSDRSGKEFDKSRNTEVWTVRAEGGMLTKISDHKGPDGSPRWSPDGSSILFVGSEDEDDPPMLYLASSAGGKPSRQISTQFDMLASDLTWAEGGKAVYFSSGSKGETHLFRIDVGSGAIRQMTKGARSVRGFSLHGASGRMAYLSNDFERPDELYALDGAVERKLTDLNGSLWGSLITAKVERMPYKAADGLEIDGFLVKPLGFDSSKKYPMVLSIHGGPAGMYGVDWYHEFQVYAAKGWAVFFTNPRGSTGYGRKFQRAVALEWGGKAYTDIMTGVDEVLKRNSWIDKIAWE